MAYRQYFESSESESSSDEESTRQVLVKDVPCKNTRCHNALIVVNTKDFYCCRDCFVNDHERQRIGGGGGILERKTLNGQGGSGLLADMDQLDNLVVKVNPGGGRDVKETTETIGMKRRSVVKQPSKEEKNKQKEQLMALMNPNACSDSEEESDEDLEESSSIESAREEIQSVLGNDLSSNFFPVHPAVGTSGSKVKSYVINVVSPWEIHAQTEEMIVLLAEIDEICNRPEGIDPRSVVANWFPEVGGPCAAKFDGRLYRAKVLEKLGENVKVKYVDYGNTAVVPFQDVSQLDPEVAMIPRQCFFLKLSNVKPPFNATKWTFEAGEFLKEHLDGGIGEVEIESVGMGVIHCGKLKLESSLSGNICGDIGNVLVENELAELDSYYNLNFLEQCPIQKATRVPLLQRINL